MVHIHKKTSKFHVLDCTAAHDERLSLGALGLHTKMITFAPDFKISIEGLVALLKRGNAKQGKDLITARMKELEACDYVFRQIKHGANGHFTGYDYHVFERPEHKNEYCIQFVYTVDGLSVDGKTDDGLTVDGKPVTNKELTKIKNELNNIHKGESPKMEVGSLPTLEQNIEAAVEWSQKNIEAVRYWYDAAKVSGDTPEDFKEKIAAFFSHYMADAGQMHPAYQSPVNFFRNGFLKWLVSGKTFKAQKSNTGQKTGPKRASSGVSDF
jgi:hypothetical protein